MGLFSFDCGAPACIAGWTVALEIWKGNVERAARMNVRGWCTSLADDQFPTSWPFNSAIQWQAAKILGLSESQARELFLSDRPVCDLRDILPEDAAYILRQFVETGRIQWSGF